MTFRPLLASKADMTKISFPVMASVKIDGIRCLVMEDGIPYSRNLKPIPNRFVRQAIKQKRISFFDGELVTFTDGKLDDFNTVQSKIMSEDGEPEWQLLAFDYTEDETVPFRQRYREVLVRAPHDSPVKPVMHKTINNMDELNEFEADAVAKGWEGIMIRDPQGPYKYGRSTANEGILLKVKRFDDSEAKIIGFEELMRNENEAAEDAFGLTERSSKKDGLVSGNTLGALVLFWNDQKVEFNLGTGFTADQRREIWDDRSRLLGKIVTFSFQGIGTNKRPRFPSFKGFRAEGDL